jgi:hypothetical protein
MNELNFCQMKSIYRLNPDPSQVATACGPSLSLIAMALGGFRSDLTRVPLTHVPPRSVCHIWSTAYPHWPRVVTTLPCCHRVSRRIIVARYLSLLSRVATGLPHTLRVPRPVPDFDISLLFIYFEKCGSYKVRPSSDLKMWNSFFYTSFNIIVG